MTWSYLLITAFIAFDSRQVEDLMHDSSICELLWTSCGDPELISSVAIEEVPLKVRSWLTVLLDRSLLLGNAAGIHLHGALLDSRQTWVIICSC